MKTIFAINKFMNIMTILIIHYWSVEMAQCLNSGRHSVNYPLRKDSGRHSVNYPLRKDSGKRVLGLSQGQAFWYEVI